MSRLFLFKQQRELINHNRRIGFQPLQNGEEAKYAGVALQGRQFYPNRPAQLGHQRNQFCIDRQNRLSDRVGKICDCDQVDLLCCAVQLLRYADACHCVPQQKIDLSIRRLHMVATSKLQHELVQCDRQHNCACDGIQHVLPNHSVHAALVASLHQKVT